MRRDNEMFHVLIALLSALCYASGIQPASGFIAVVSTKKPDDGWTLPLCPPPPLPYHPVMRGDIWSSWQRNPPLLRQMSAT